MPDENFNMLVLLVDFTDEWAYTNETFFDTLIYEPQTGTLTDYFDEVTYGNWTITTVNLPSTTGWFEAPQPSTYYIDSLEGLGDYPNNVQKLVEDVVAMANANPAVDFSFYDNDGDTLIECLFIVHAGQSTQVTGDTIADFATVKWNTHTPIWVDSVYVDVFAIAPEYNHEPGDGTIGGFAHEAGHAIFGLPDMYDTDYSSNGLGNWSLMASGDYNGNNGDSPAHPDAWCKIKMEVVTPTVVSHNLIEETISAAVIYPMVYRLWTSGSASNEYFLVENRQRIGYDAALPGDGLLIYHVSDTVSTENTKEWYPGHTNSGHYLVALEQADGQWHLEHNTNEGDTGDPFPGSTSNTSFDSLSVPDSKGYNFVNTNVAVSNISASTTHMTADLTVEEGPGPLWTQTYGGSSNDYGRSVQQTSDEGYIIAGYTNSFGAGGDDVYLVKTDASGIEQWSQTFGGSGDDYGYSVQQTSDGGYIIVGETEPYGASLSDVYLIKTDADGNEQWSQIHGGSNDDAGHSVQQTSDSGYIIAGKTYSSGAGGPDVWLIKCGAIGEEQWSQTFGGYENDYGRSVQQTSDGGYIIAGYSNSTVNEDDDVYLIKTNSAGALQWSQYLGGSEDDYGYSVQQTSDNGYIIVGETESFGASFSDVYLIKTNSSGYQVWSQTFGRTSDDWGNSVQQTSDGGYIIAGMTYSDGPSRDVYLVKTDASGSEQWSQIYGGDNRDEGYSVKQTSDDGYIIAGHTNSYGVGYYDVWLIRMDSEGLLAVDFGTTHRPTEFAIDSPYPNPFNPTAVLRYELQAASLVELSVYDITGRLVAKLVDGWRKAGSHQVTLDATGFASGVYIYSFRAGEFNDTGKMVLMK
jgi:M6 family metalloprotease-like protein